VTQPAEALGPRARQKLSHRERGRVAGPAAWVWRRARDGRSAVESQGITMLTGGVQELNLSSRNARAERAAARPEYSCAGRGKGGRLFPGRRFAQQNEVPGLASPTLGPGARRVQPRSATSWRWGRGRTQEDVAAPAITLVQRSSPAGAATAPRAAGHPPPLRSLLGGNVWSWSRVLTMRRMCAMTAASAAARRDQPGQRTPGRVSGRVRRVRRRQQPALAVWPVIGRLAPRGQPGTRRGRHAPPA